MKLEEIITRAARTGTDKNVDLAKRAMARFREKWPEACATVEAFRFSLEVAKLKLEEKKRQGGCGGPTGDALSGR